MRAAFSHAIKSPSYSQTRRRNKDETKFVNFYYLYQNDKSDTKTLLFNKWSVTKKKIEEIQKREIQKGG